MNLDFCGLKDSSEKDYRKINQKWGLVIVDMTTWPPHPTALWLPGGVGQLLPNH